jgi:cohesin loading factor subunit SCC2
MNIDDDDADSPDELWDEDDDRGDDGEWMAARAGRKAFRSPSPGQYGAMATSGRVGSIIKTGEKDLRSELNIILLRLLHAWRSSQPAAYQKFASLLEDILEASDALPAEPTADDLTRSRFFDRLNRDSALPLLSTETVERVTRYVSRIHSSHRARPTNPAVQSWDEEQLKALFRHLERIMRDAEGVVPFPVDSKATAHDQDSQKAKSKKKGKKGKGSQSPEVETQESNGTATDGIDEETGQKGERALSAISAAATAAECCLAILDGEGLSKPVSLTESPTKTQLTFLVVFRRPVEPGCWPRQKPDGRRDFLGRRGNGRSE